ncbi:hypothetical protein [Sulfurimonas sp. C5]|uniref:hypothetical protein n=1 Tax=Sulfurimonas sp. C5 TaxID=3036947 RepID=UPI002458919D|nr:hypothetical protein [Sulfurimonas sp. C5]MDH4945154.1 hypothetical protein [Sulfurimonas sp. C5]
MIPIKIEHKFRGKIELPHNKYAKDLFFRVKQAYANHEQMGVHLLFNKHKLKKLSTYQKGGAKCELENLDFYIKLGKILDFNTSDAQKLKNSILFINDAAHTHFNITKRLKLINKEQKKDLQKSYLFWDIENFSAITSIFSEIIEPYKIQDKNIYLAANPDSLYLKRAEWEANLYDYGKTLNSFNFIKCDHGKNVADDVLLNKYKSLNIKNANVFLLTFDRELKERFSEVIDKNTNLYIMSK